MRWRFADEKNQAERTERQRVLDQIDSWWREFTLKTGDLSALFSSQTDWDLVGWMEQHLQAIHPNLMWEFGPALRCDGHRLVITPEAAHDLRPLVRIILARAPELKGWEFYEFRQPEEIEAVLSTVEGRTGVDVKDFRVKVARGDGHLINLSFTASTITDPEDQEAFNAAFVATESLLGEQCLDQWIGGIDLVAKAGKKELPHFLPLGKLKNTVHALIRSMREQLPPEPHFEWIAGAEWTMWEIEPDEADDYLDQEDLCVAKSANPEQWRAAHLGGIFSSSRFSRCGECFCYVKLDGSDGLPDGGFEDKSEIEDALDAALKPGKLGCHIGGGTGLRYSYVDLALTDVEQAIPVIRQRLQQGKVPRRSWILFHDRELAAEWVGVYDDTPPPPGAEPS